MDGREPRVLAERVQRAYATHLPAGKGFLPPVVPVDRLPEEFALYLRACDELPARVVPGGRCGSPGTTRRFPAPSTASPRWNDKS